MRIALVSPLYESVPPVTYGGTERVIGALANELVARGHDVTLFAAGGSDTAATLVAASPAPLRQTMTRAELEQVAPAPPHEDAGRRVPGRTRPLRHRARPHRHLDPAVRQFVPVPTVVTMHGRLDLDVVRAVLPRYAGTPFVSISDDQRRAVADLPVRWVATCPNGLDLDPYFAAPRPASSDYLAFVGRITPEKRPDWAVEVARRAGRPLRVAAKIDPLDVDYWHTVIEPLFRSSDVEFVGEIGEAEKPEFFAGAAATLFPIDWPEPFGLVMIESLASGTPVIALRNGSVPEVLRHGESGFVCDSLDEMVEAIAHVDSISARGLSPRGATVHGAGDDRQLPRGLRRTRRRAAVR